MQFITTSLEREYKVSSTAFNETVANRIVTDRSEQDRKTNLRNELYKVYKEWENQADSF